MERRRQRLRDSLTDEADPENPVHCHNTPPAFCLPEPIDSA
jgi:hypothetical protein